MEEEENRRYGCRCFCCICCHVRAACIVVCILQMLGVVIGVALQAHALSWEPPVPLLQAVGSILLYLLLGFTAFLVFVAIRVGRAVLVVPHIVVQALMVLYHVIMFGSSINAVLKVREAAAQQKRFLERHPDRTEPIEYGAPMYGDVVASNQATVSLIAIGVLIAIMFALSIIYAWFIYLFFRLRRYLLDKQLTGGVTAEGIRSSISASTTMLATERAKNGHYGSAISPLYR